MRTGLRIQIQMNALEMMFALQQIYNPSVHQQFPNFPFKAKKELEKKLPLKKTKNDNNNTITTSRLPHLPRLNTNPSMH